MSDNIVKIEIKHDPETGDMKLDSNTEPAGIVSLLEMAKHQVLSDSLGDGFSKISRWSLMENKYAGSAIILGTVSVIGGAMEVSPGNLAAAAPLIIGALAIAFGTAGYDIQVKNLRRKLENQSSRWSLMSNDYVMVRVQDEDGSVLMGEDGEYKIDIPKSEFERMEEPRLFIHDSENGKARTILIEEVFKSDVEEKSDEWRNSAGCDKQTLWYEGK